MGEGRHPVALTPMRAAIARRMTQSKQEAPHFYVTTDILMQRVLGAADEHNEGRSREERVTLTAFLVRAAALALAEHRSFNAVWSGATLELVDSINIGVAIAVPDGLIAPALLDCEHRDVLSIARGLRDLVERSRTGKWRAPEINDATFTLSNLGMFEVTAFTAIVTPPQVAILATAKVQQLPRLVDGAVVAAPVMTATLSSDHRAVDGAAAARLLGTFKARLEDPQAWVSAG